MSGSKNTSADLEVIHPDFRLARAIQRLLASQPDGVYQMRVDEIIKQGDGLQVYGIYLGTKK